MRSSRGGGHAGTFTPGAGGGVAGGMVLIGGQAVAAELEVVVDAALSREEALCMPC